ncbi:glycosyltransferase family 1 protein [Mangrovimicrobium sediminis]|uniref:Glycosyltransferase family 1 protein n=1 Tax=Mangrovimicrobium sediminis TaxID=2562682 RepID=A0A4Z0M111_9GAMM|nr:glycosyltransferase family 4 protein [Haliea sp. SAOS-164]TGD73117.1 glycosyltransferase family 1 protein [Haliea sp. SAOS-164]
MGLTVSLSANTSWYLLNFRASTIRALRERGDRVVCLSPRDDYSQRLVDDLGCEWRELRMDNQGSNPLRDLGLVAQFLGAYCELRPDAALHFTIKNNVYGTWAARATGVPAINNVSGLGTAFIRRGVLGAVVRLLYRSSQPFALRVFCQNEEDAAQLREARLVAPEKLELLPGSGVDLQRFSPVPSARPAEAPFVFLYAGRMLADKGLHELVAAVHTLHDEGLALRLQLCGFAGVENVSAIGEAQLQAWSQHPAIEWLGPSDDMPAVYAKADCVVLPSYREGMPRSLLEAGAMALPVIATDVPGCRNIVTHDFNGLLCEVRSAASLADAMRRMLAMDASERRALGERGRERVSSQYDERLVVEAALRAIDTACACG